ncbi:MAG: DMT family transporter [Clostridia bacterium]|nr:DMT family transporter [Clostridia bacterium]
MKPENKGYIFLLNTVVLFSTFEVVSKTLVGKIDPFQINFIRFFVGGLILLIFLMTKKDLYIQKKDLTLVALVGIVNVAISMNLLQLSLYVPNAKASVVAVIFSSNPIFVFAFSVLIDKEEAHIYKLAGMFVGIIGIIIIFFERLQLNGLRYTSPLLALTSAVFYGLYTVIGRKASMRVGSLKMNSYSFLIGSGILLPMFILFKIPLVEFDYSGIWQVAYLAVLVTGLAYLTYFKGLSMIGASKGSLVFFIKPVLASLIAILFLKEQPSINLFVGTILIVAGIVITIYWPLMSAKFFKRHAGFSK